jgi:AraC family transcriptional regulator, ethanolamine operon transcriptional activator
VAKVRKDPKGSKTATEPAPPSRALKDKAMSPRGPTSADRLERRGAGPSSPFLELRSTDFDEIALAFQRWNHRFQQLSRGPFRGSFALAQAEGVQLLRVSVNRVIHAQGAPPRDSFLFAPVGEDNRGAVFRKRHLPVGALVAIAPGGEMDHLSSADYSTLALTVDGQALRASAAVLGGVEPDKVLGGKVAVTPGMGPCLAFQAHLGQLLAKLGESPALLTDPRAGRQLAQDCLRRLVRLLTRIDPRGADPVRPSNPVRLVLRAEDLMRACLRDPLTTFDLCRELQVSERTLQYAFREVRGMSPMAYYKAKRLNAVRQDLRGEGADTATVHEVAQRWGFWHTGEFAADYRRLFGELPSQTLRGSRPVAYPPAGA